MAPPKLYIFARIALGLLLVYAAVAKIVSHSTGASSGTLYAEITNTPLRHWVVVIFELGLGIWLLSGIYVFASSAILLVSLSIFIGLLVRDYQRPIPKPCGCMAISKSETDPEKIRTMLLFGIGSNLSLLLIACMLFNSSTRNVRAVSINYPNKGRS